MTATDEWVNQIHTGDTRTVLDALPESSVHCVVTSPPYWSLRDYGHPNQLGLEPTVTEYVDQLVAVGEQIQRVLRSDGSWWLNLGDTYAGGGGVVGKPDDYDDLHDDEHYPSDSPARQSHFTRKCKLAIPHRVAIALIDAGWILRSDAVWKKTAPMPSSVKDRLNETKEFVFHLTPNPDYWFDLDAIREPHAESSIERHEYGYTSAGGQVMQCPQEDREEHVTINDDEGLHSNGKNPGDIFEITPASFPDAHFAVYPTQLVETPVKATCPAHVCAACGTPYERATVERALSLDQETVPARKQTRRALKLAREADLTDEHLQACRAVGFGDAGTGKHCQTGTGNNDQRVEDLAAEAKDVLGGYFREFCSPRRTLTGWEQACECATDESEPGIVLDPFCGAGTTCLVAKRLGRRFVGIELNEEYTALAQARCGLDVDDPTALTEDEQLGLTAFADGGER